MIYKVLLDGVEIYNQDKDMALLSPTVTIELNSAGSFEFTMPSNHKYYNKPVVLLSTVEVYEDGVLIFYGRPIETEIDFLNRKKVYCEGALAFFNDTIQRPKTYNKVTAYDFLNDLISNHNEQVSDNRKFYTGTVNLYDEDETTDEEEIEDRKLYRELNYETTFECIQKMCIEAEGGYIFIRRVLDKNYVDWLKKMPYEGTQPIQFALNMLDLKQNVNSTEIKTSILPLGAEVDGKKLTVKSVNSGKDYIDSETGTELYGRVLEVVEFNEVTKANKLKKKAIEWLEDKQFDVLTIDIDAAELHYLNHDYKAFQVGQNVHCYSEPHGILNREFPLSKITLNLDSGVKKITIGTVPKRSLTDIYKSQHNKKDDDKPQETIPPILVEKNITENGTYYANNETVTETVDGVEVTKNANGYSVVNVNIPVSYDHYGFHRVWAIAHSNIAVNQSVYLYVGNLESEEEYTLTKVNAGCVLPSKSNSCILYDHDLGDVYATDVFAVIEGGVTIPATIPELSLITPYPYQIVLLKAIKMDDSFYYQPMLTPWVVGSYFVSEITGMVGDADLACAYEVTSSSVRIVGFYPATVTEAFFIQESISEGAKVFDILSDNMGNRKGNKIIFPFGVLDIESHDLTFFTDYSGVIDTGEETEDLTDWDYLIGLRSTEHFVVQHKFSSNRFGAIALFKMEESGLKFIAQTEEEYKVVCSNGIKVIAIDRSNKFYSIDVTIVPFAITSVSGPLLSVINFVQSSDKVRYCISPDDSLALISRYNDSTYLMLYDIGTGGKKCDVRINTEKASGRSEAIYLSGKFAFDGYEIYELNSDLYASLARNDLHGHYALGFSSQQCTEGQRYQFDIIFE